ncbi:MAG: proton-dependent oligopeptide transporter, family [Sphingomonadales bacterium]|jgi:POT family proton-dependent oligopeptide transporter|nr:proton-dependent oligopeptide transporter, family [Sphingomonadales bacterium]
MTVAEATPEIDVENRLDTAFLGHPKGLGYLAFTEACERFSYYSMQTLLVLYMVHQLLLPGHIENIAGFDWLRRHFYGSLTGQPLASAIYGSYTSLVYLTPIAGGMLADGLLGRRRTVALGAVLMAMGHFLMAFEQSFLLALFCLVLGVGCFKGNIASQVGGLYGPGDLRRATAFQIFYIAINVSVIAGPLVSGTLGEKVGWHYGFGAAGVMMVVGLVIYLSGTRYLPADDARDRASRAARPRLTRADWTPVIALLLLVPALGIALLTNQEIFNAYLVWGDQHFDLTFFGVTWPTSWLITIDATLSFSMLVAVAAFWRFWGRKRTEPDELGKMIVGSLFTIAGGLCLVAAAFYQGATGAKIGLFWPLMFHLLNSIGFAHILPVSLALFSKVAPRAINATVIGLYYLAFAAANAVVGKIGGLYSSLPTTSFWLIHVASAAIGLVAFLLFKLFVGRRLVEARAADPLA